MFIQVDCAGYRYKNLFGCSIRAYSIISHDLLRNTNFHCVRRITLTRAEVHKLMHRQSRKIVKIASSALCDHT